MFYILQFADPKYAPPPVGICHLQDQSLFNILVKNLEIDIGKAGKKNLIRLESLEHPKETDRLFEVEATTILTPLAAILTQVISMAATILAPTAVETVTIIIVIIRMGTEMVIMAITTTITTTTIIMEEAITATTDIKNKNSTALKLQTNATAPTAATTPPNWLLLNSSIAPLPTSSVPAVSPGVTVSSSSIPAVAGTTKRLINIYRGNQCRYGENSKERLLDNFNFTFQVRFSDCVEDKSLGNAAEFIQGLTTSRALADLDRFPTLLMTSGNSLSLGRALVSVMQQFNWKMFAYIYSTDQHQRCNFIRSDIEAAVDESNYDLFISYSRRVDNITLTTVRDILKEAAKSSRVFTLCFDTDDDKRTFFLAVNDLGLNIDDYVYILLELRSLQFNVTKVSKNMTGDQQTIPIWVDQGTPADGRDQDAFKGIAKAFVLDLSGDTTANLTQFRSDVIQKVTGWPFYCIECARANATSTLASQLSDTFYLYGIALNKTLRQLSNSLNSSASLQSLRGLTSRAQDIAYMEIKFSDSNWTLKAMYPEATIWANRAGIRPLDQPKCGFDGTKCQPDIWAIYGVYIVIAAILIVVLLASTIVFFIQTRRNEIRRLNLLWQVRFIELQKPLSRSDPNSASSAPSTLASKSVAARKFEFRTQLLAQDLNQIRAMCRVENDNLGKFVGLCLDGPTCMAVWRYYDRGSIQNVIARGTFAMDGVFMLSLIKDIANGISFIHTAPFLVCHGRLTSSNCLVDERWVVKVGDYGLERMYDEEPITPRQMLKPGDIYSFAIICSEIITKRPAWNIESNNEKLDEHIHRIKRGGDNAPRPSLETNEVTDLNNAIYHLIRDCWEENPRSRPAINQIRSLLRSMGGRNENIMDHVFRILEQYTTNLQQDVEERTKELMDEKKRSDLLLYRMLPRQVADKLKSGTTIEPESYDSVTVFFSDISKFADIASKCTPLQVINLLNDLFIMFDEIIETFDCYKVESVGYVTLVVSGLPRRNGIQHVKEIANMSLTLMTNVANFRIIHLPSETVTISIGFHSGPCVAGVVGLTMPRFCLFGDTINTASRMESNGRPGRIHLSSDANNLLQIAGGFKTENRGEVIIKGKGVMETYWLISRASDAADSNHKKDTNLFVNPKDPLYQQFLQSHK
uniref:Guanylate cyclase n=1 Tax=Ditylenchus dipsaci TaxID=166011 RepID=A0A915EVX2_9BILA